MSRFSEQQAAAGASTLRRLKFLITPRWIAMILAVTVFTLSAFLFLAPWQFSRSRQQAEQNAQIAAAIAAAPVPISQLMSLDSQPPAHAIWHTVTATGTFDASKQVYVRLRQDNSGNPASEVVVPLVMADGTAVLVDRGYVSFTSVQAAAPLPPLPAGTVTVTGRVQADLVDPKHRPPVPAPDGREQYLATNSELAGPGRAYRGFIQLTPDSPAVIQPIALPQQDSGPFFSYALQWIGFGIIAVVGIGYFIYREFSDPVSGDIYIGPGGDGPADVAGDAYRDAARGGANGAGDTADAVGPAAVGGETAVYDDVLATGAAGNRADDHAPGAKRARRARFDKSQLYDE